MSAGRHHDVTEFERFAITKAQELSKAVKSRADLDANPQIAFANLCRSMGQRKVLEILREIDDPTTPKGAPKATTGALSFTTTRNCAHCGSEYKPTGPRRLYCSVECIAAANPKQAYQIELQRKRREKRKQEASHV